MTEKRPHLQLVSNKTYDLKKDSLTAMMSAALDFVGPATIGTVDEGLPLDPELPELLPPEFDPPELDLELDPPELLPLLPLLDPELPPPPEAVLLPSALVEPVQ